MRRWSRATVAGMLLVPALLFVGPAGAVTPRASNGSVASVTAETLVTKYFTLLQQKDEAGLRRFLSPAFTLQRADGSLVTSIAAMRK